MMANVHIRKNMLKRPTLEDIKGNSYTAYRATVALGVFNDAKAAGIHKSKILWEEAGNDGHLRSYPVLETWFIKSKVDDCKYPVVAFQQWPHKGKVREIADPQQDQFVNLIYGEA